MAFGFLAASESHSPEDSFLYNHLLLERDSSADVDIDTDADVRTDAAAAAAKTNLNLLDIPASVRLFRSVATS